MKSCPICLDSAEVNAARCPSCGERFFTPVTQSVATLINPKPTVTGQRPTRARLKPKINPLVKLYSLVFLATAGIGVAALVVFNNNSTNSGNSGVSSTSEPREDAKQVPGEDEAKEETYDYVLSSSIQEKLMQAGVCDGITFDTGGEAIHYKDDMFRSCYIESKSGMGDKFVSIYTGPFLPSKYADLERLKVFEASVMGEGWTVVTNFYPAQGKTYLDDPDIKAILKLLGGRIIARND